MKHTKQKKRRADRLAKEHIHRNKRSGQQAFQLARVRRKSSGGYELMCESAEGARIASRSRPLRVSQRNLLDALPGDLVLFKRIHGGASTASEARVEKVLERAHRTFLGRLEFLGELAAVVPFSRELPNDFFLVPEELARFRELYPPEAKRLFGGYDLYVEVIIEEYPAYRAGGTVRVKRVLDLREAAREAFAAHCKDRGFIPGRYCNASSPELQHELSCLHEPVFDERVEKIRKDLCDQTAFTIDPATAEDMDDALYVEKTSAGYCLYVHIADVSAFVPCASSIDLAAREQSMSAYLAEGVVSMLPAQLSEDLCSLQPGVVRRAMTVCMELDHEGSIRSSRIMPSFIRSRAKLNYAKVQAFLEEHSCTGANSQLSDSGRFEPAIQAQLQLMAEVQALRHQARKKRHALDFSGFECHFIAADSADELGLMSQSYEAAPDAQLLLKSSKNRATMMVEEAMILANEAVARFLDSHQALAVFRSHEKPTEEDFEELELRLRSIGVAREHETGEAFMWRYMQEAENEAQTPKSEKQMYESPEQIQQASQAILIERWLKLAQQKARYTVEDEGHFALALANYCHFTSPIRRYPDLIVHRVVKALLLGRRPQSRDSVLGMQMRRDQLSRLCAHMTRQEMNAEKLERASYRRAFTQALFERQEKLCAQGEKLPPLLAAVDTVDDEVAELVLANNSMRVLLWRDKNPTHLNLGDIVLLDVKKLDVVRGSFDLRLRAILN